VKMMGVLTLVRLLMKSYFADFKGPLHLIKTTNLEDKDYQLVTPPSVNLQYFDSIDEALDQDERSRDKWVNFFHNTKGQP
jgi:hypothetical protein